MKKKPWSLVQGNRQEKYWGKIGEGELLVFNVETVD